MLERMAIMRQDTVIVALGLEDAEHFATNDASQ
jgi:hypothetical protein